MTNKTLGATNSITAEAITGGKIAAARLPAGTIILINTDETDTNGTTATNPIKSYVVAANSYSNILVEAEIGLVQSGNNDGNWNFIIDYAGTAKETIPIRGKGNNAGDSHSLSGSIKYSEALTGGGTVKIYNTATTANGTWHVRSFRVYGII
ncbi:hypothetical protein HZC34_01315 [Candidatus Saganbacteria bacterium]|nr:hypothetical protein [Candidatus Saganbacteria bacterium]